MGRRKKIGFDPNKRIEIKLNKEERDAIVRCSTIGSKDFAENLGDKELLDYARSCDRAISKIVNNEGEKLIKFTQREFVGFNQCIILGIKMHEEEEDSFYRNCAKLADKTLFKIYDAVNEQLYNGLKVF